MIRGVPYDAEVEYLESLNSKTYLNTGLRSYTSSTVSSLKKASYEGDVAYFRNSDGFFGHNGWGFWGRRGTSGCFMRAGVNESTFHADLGKFYHVRCVFSAVSSEGGLWVDDRLVTANTSNSGNANSYGIGLFCLGNWDGSVTGGYGGHFRVGHIRVESMGEVRDFIPVRVGTIGAMYDRAHPNGGPRGNGLYFSNGSVAFGVGPDVATPVMGLHFTRPYVAAHTARDYVQDGLVALFDVKENKDWGVHDAAATTWIDLTGHEAPLTFPWGGVTWSEKSVRYYLAAQNPAVRRSYPGGLTVEWISPSPLTVIFNNSDTFIKYEYPNVNLVRAIYGNTSVDISSSGIYSATSQTKNATLTSGPGGTKVYFKGAGRVVSSARQIGATARSGMICLGKKVNGQVCYASGFRLYNRVLTTEEVAHNHAIDVERFGIP